MRRIALSMLSLLAVACSKDIDEVSLKQVQKEETVEENTNEAAKEDSEENSQEQSETPPEEEPDNRAPVFEEQRFAINEHSSPGTTIGFLTAIDADEDEITYFLDSQTDIVLDENTGELTIGANLNLDFETGPTLAFEVSAFDGKILTEKTFTLEVQDVDEVTLLSEEQKELVDYFQYLTFWKGPSHNANDKVQKWGNAVQLNLQGTISTDFQSTVESVISQFNSLFTDGDFNVSLTENSADANAELFFGAKEEVEAIWPDMYDIIKDGNYSGYAMTPSQNSVLISTRIWVSDPLEVLLKHELGHALGFGHSDKCEDEHSFLCSQISSNNDILPVEADIIRYLYHPAVSAGLSEEEVVKVLADILLNES